LLWYKLKNFCLISDVSNIDNKGYFEYKVSNSFLVYFCIK
jgi:hypothetical protein